MHQLILLLLTQPEEAVEEVAVAEASQRLISVHCVGQCNGHARIAVGEPRDRREVDLRDVGELLPNDFLDELGEGGLIEDAPLPVSGARLVDIEASAVAAALRAHGGNVSATARALGISRTTLYRKLRV